MFITLGTIVSVHNIECVLISEVSTVRGSTVFFGHCLIECPLNLQLKQYGRVNLPCLLHHSSSCSPSCLMVCSSQPAASGLCCFTHTLGSSSINNSFITLSTTLSHSFLGQISGVSTSCSKPVYTSH